MEIFAFGVPISIFYFLPRLKDDKKKIFIIQSLIILCILAFCFTIILYIFSSNIALFFNNIELEKYLKIFCLYPIFALPIMGVQSISISLDRTSHFAIISLIDRIIFLLLAVSSVLIFKDIEHLLVTIIIYSLFQFSGYIYIVFFFTKSIKIASKKFQIKRQLKFAFPSGISNIIGILNQEIDKLMIGAFFTVSQFAKYINGAFEIPFVGTIAASVSSVLMPEFAKKSQQKDYLSLIKLWHRAICKVAIFLIPLAVFLFIFANEFITLMFSKKYQDSSIIFQIYLIALLPKVTWYGPILVSMGYNKEPFYGAGLALTTNVVLNFLFIKLIGFTGPAISTVFTTYIVSAFYLIRISTVTGVSYDKIFPWIEIIKIILIASIVGTIIWALFQPVSLAIILKFAIGSALYFFIVFIFLKKYMLIEKQDFEIIKSLIRKKDKITI
jgi:O-antigen/teichoic acid export membrane protein